MKDKVILKIAILGALCIMFWPDVKNFINPKRKKEEEDIEIDDIPMPDIDPVEPREDCEKVVYQPLSLAGLHVDPTLPKGYCSKGDSFFDDKPHETGDAYADDQAEDFESLKGVESALDKLDSVVLTLRNTGASDIDSTIGDSTSDSSVWGSSTTPVPTFSLLTADYSGTQISITIALPIGKSITIYWGDGNSEVIDNGGTTVTSVYSSSASYSVTLTGDYTEITSINFQNEDVSGDISGWSELVNLTGINIFDTSLSGDISGFSSMTNLISFDGGLSSVSGDISSWVSMTGLRILLLNYTSVSGDVSGFSALTDLSSIWLTSTSVTGDISGWSALTGINSIIVSDTSVTGDISGWSALTSITYISVSDTSLTGDISGWSALTSLANISVSDTSLTGDISGWSALTSLATLVGDNTSLSGDISSFTTLTSLTILILSDSSVSGDISGWSVLTSIQYIILNDTSVSGDISSWATLTSLTTMTINDTSVDFDSSSAWTGHDHDVALHDCALTATQVDNILIALDGGSFTSENINIAGTNASRTSASDTAYANLVSAGNTVTVN